MDAGEIIGAVVRSRPGVKPLYVSIGHRVDLVTSIELVLRCTRGYRLPETTRYAHKVAGGTDLGLGQTQRNRFAAPRSSQLRPSPTRGVRQEDA